MESGRRGVNTHRRIALVSGPTDAVHARGTAPKTPNVLASRAYRAEALPQECRYELSDEEACTLSSSIDALPPLTERRIDDDDLLSEIALTSDEGLSQELRRRLRSFHQHSNEWGALLVRNLPTDPNLPPTPVNGGPVRGKTSWISEYGLLLLMTRFGDPRGYFDEKGGAIIQNFYPIPGREEKQENSGSNAFLEFHTEDGFLSERADFLGLGCVRRDHDGVARTGIASGWRAIHGISSVAMDWLREPLYQIAVPLSFKNDDDIDPVWSELMPVLSGDTLYPELNIDLDAMRAVNKAGQYALEEISSALLDVAVDCVLEPGDLLIIDNRTAAHARSGFSPRYDGQDRWLQRIKIVVDARSSQRNRKRGCRVCGPMSLALPPAGDKIAQ